jgi:hypothetical protein
MDETNDAQGRKIRLADGGSVLKGSGGEVGPAAQCAYSVFKPNQFYFNGFKFAPNFDR